MPKQHDFSPTGDYVGQAINNLISETQAATRAVKNFFSKYSWSVFYVEWDGNIQDDGYRIDAKIEGWGEVYCQLLQAREGNTVIKNCKSEYNTSGYGKIIHNITIIGNGLILLIWGMLLCRMKISSTANGEACLLMLLLFFLKRTICPFVVQKNL